MWIEISSSTACFTHYSPLETLPGDTILLTICSYPLIPSLYYYYEYLINMYIINKLISRAKKTCVTN